MAATSLWCALVVMMLIGCGGACEELQEICKQCLDPNHQAACEHSVDNDADETCEQNIDSYGNVFN